MQLLATETNMTARKGDNKHDESDESISSLLIDNQLIASAKQISNHLITFLEVLVKK